MCVCVWLQWSLIDHGRPDSYSDYSAHLRVVTVDSVSLGLLLKSALSHTQAVLLFVSIQGMLSLFQAT